MIWKCYPISICLYLKQYLYLNIATEHKQNRNKLKIHQNLELSRCTAVNGLEKKKLAKSQ